MSRIELYITTDRTGFHAWKPSILRRSNQRQPVTNLLEVCLQVLRQPFVALTTEIRAWRNPYLLRSF